MNPYILNTISNFQEMNAYYRKVVFGMYFETLIKQKMPIKKI